MIVAACVGPIELPRRLSLGEDLRLFCEECTVSHYHDNAGMIFVDSFKPNELRDLKMWYGDPLDIELCFERKKINQKFRGEMTMMLGHMERILTELIEVESQILEMVYQHSLIYKAYELSKSLTKEQIQEVMRIASKV